MLTTLTAHPPTPHTYQAKKMYTTVDAGGYSICMAITRVCVCTCLRQVRIEIACCYNVVILNQDDITHST